MFSVRLTTSPPIQTPTRSERTRTFMIGKVGSVKGQGYTTFLSDMLSILNILVIFVILKKVGWSWPFLGYILLKKSFVYTNNNTSNFKIWNTALFNDSLWLNKSYQNWLYMIRVQNNYPLKWTLSIYCSFSFSLFFHFDPHFEILYHKVNFVFIFYFFSIKWHGFKQFSVQNKISDCLKKNKYIHQRFSVRD